MNNALEDAHTIQDLATMFHLLGDSNRLGMILCCLNHPCPVGVIAEQMGLSQSLVSHHLRLLRDARLMDTERDGKRILYRLADDHIRTMLMGMIEHAKEPHEHPPHPHSSEISHVPS